MKLDDGSRMSREAQVRFCERRGVRLPPATHPRVSDFGLSLLNSIVVRRVAREHLKEMRAQTGRTASLGILGGTEVAYIDRWQGSRRGQYAIDVGIGLGTRRPVHCTAAGKALLACLPAAEQLDLIIKLRLPKRGPKTITTKTALRTELERVVAGGIAVEDEELLAGRRAIAAVVVDGEGTAVAAVELVVPVQAYARGRLPKELGPDVTATARRITAALG